MAARKIHDIANASRKCSVMPGNNDEFEVHDGKPKYAVKLREKTCSCRLWAITGMPCKYAALCIGYNRGRLQDFCHEFYHVKTYQTAYSGVIHPLPEYDYTNIDPSTYILPLP